MENVEESISNDLLSLPKEFIIKLSSANLLLIYIQRFIIQYFLKERIISEEDINKLNNAFCKSKDIKSKEQLSNYIKEQGMLYADHINNLKASIHINSISIDNFGRKAEAHFLKRKDQLDQYIYSLIRLKDSDLAYELYLQIDEKESKLSDLSIKYSEGPEKNTNGKIGPSSIMNAHPILREKLKASSIGELIKPFKIESWWLIARLEDKMEVSFDDTMKAKMSIELFDLWSQNLSKRISYKLIELLAN